MTTRTAGPRRRRDWTTELNESERCELEMGIPLIDALALDDAQLELAWQRHGETLLAEFIGEHPGRRPFAWYRFVGIPQHGERRIIDSRFTREDLISLELHGILDTWMIPPLQESQQEYLRRCGELTPDELIAIEGGASW